MIHQEKKLSNLTIVRIDITMIKISQSFYKELLDSFDDGWHTRTLPVTFPIMGQVITRFVTISPCEAPCTKMC
jgi:hypothetical protein